MPKPIVIAHRGASGTRPENTLAAFRRAIEIGADAIETDLWLAADGTAVIMHDATVDRTTNGSGRIWDLTVAQLQQLDAGSWFAPEYAGERPPTLEQAVELAAGKIPMHLELKQRGGEAQAVAAVRTRGDEHWLICSFDDQCLVKAREHDPTIRLGLIVGIDPLGDAEIAALVARVRHLGAGALCASYRGVTAALVQAAQAEGIEVITWTVNRAEDIARMMALGVNGITSDFPERVLEIRGT